MAVANKISSYLDSLNSNGDDTEENFKITNSKNSIIVGNSPAGKIAFNKEAVEYGLVRCLTAGTTGSGKSYTTRAIIEAFLKEDSFSNVIADPEGEYYTLREEYDLVLVGADPEENDIVLEETLEESDEPVVFCNTVSAEQLGEKIATNKMNVVIDLSSLEEETQQRIANDVFKAILKNKKSKKRKGMIPTNIFIEEASIFAKSGTGNDHGKRCKDTLKTLSKRGRKYAINTFFNTQRFTQLHNDIKSECDTKIIGYFNEENDIERCKTYFGVRRLTEAKKLISQLYKKYEFYAIGNSFDHSTETNKAIRFKSNKVETRHPKILDREPGYLPPRSEKVEEWIMQILGKAIPKQSESEVKEKPVEPPKPKVSKEKKEDNLTLDIVKYFGSLSFVDLHLLTKRDDYDYINTSLEYHLFFKNKEDFEINDNTVVYLGEESIDCPIESEDIIKYWRKYVNNSSMSNVIKYLWDNGNDSNSLEEVADVLNIEIPKLSQIVFEFDKLNIVKISEGNVWLNSLLLFDQEFDEEDDECDEEDEEFEDDEDYEF